MVHDREAHKDTFDILKAENNGSKVLFHCFSGSVEFMQQCVKENWLIAIGGVVTFKNSIKMKEVAVNVPLKNLVLETDSPYLAPVPKRGKRNESAFVPYIAEFLSTVYGCTVEHVAKVTTCNANRLFSKITCL